LNLLKGRTREKVTEEEKGRGEKKRKKRGESRPSRGYNPTIH